MIPLPNLSALEIVTTGAGEGKRMRLEPADAYVPMDATTQIEWTARLKPANRTYEKYIRMPIFKQPEPGALPELELSDVFQEFDKLRPYEQMFVFPNGLNGTSLKTFLMRVAWAVMNAFEHKFGAEHVEKIFQFAAQSFYDLLEYDVRSATRLVEDIQTRTQRRAKTPNLLAMLDVDFKVEEDLLIGLLNNYKYAFAAFEQYFDIMTGEGQEDDPIWRNIEASHNETRSALYEIAAFMGFFFDAHRSQAYQPAGAAP